MNKLLLTLPFAILVAGCAERMEITSAPVDVSRTNAFQSENYVGNHPVEVRSFAVAETAQGKKEETEFSGAACTIKGRGFNAKFSTPAIVNFPDHGYRSQAVTGSCQVQSTVRPIVAHPYNITVANIKSNSGAGGGVLGMVVAGVANSIALAANDETNDDFGFRPVQVKFPASDIQPQQ